MRKAAPASGKSGLWRALRISVLLYLLVFVAAGTWLAGTHSTDWNNTLYMAIYPVNGDGSTRSAGYIKTLEADDFRSIEGFMAREVKRYGIALDEPIKIEVGSPTGAPPAPPQRQNPVTIAWWSLKLRYFAWRAERAQDLPRPDIRMFVMYYDPQREQRLAHSLGLRKGLIGVVHGFAGRAHAAQNNFVVAHEMLHTLGATDKYSLATNLPIFPQGYAEPRREPLHPQRYAEIMGGRTALSPTNAQMPDGLARGTVIGLYTAEELNWVERIHSGE